MSSRVRKELQPLKEWLKEKAIEIREAKLQLKDKQRSDTIYSLWKDHLHVDNLRSDYRHHLLAYSFLRGRKYHQVESKVREYNEPSFKKVEDIMSKYPNYKEFLKHALEVKDDGEETVRVSA